MKTSLGFIMAVLFCPYVLSQEFISGTITGENNQPLEGAHIQNGKFKTTSDANGKFEVGCSDKNEIKITFIGYEDLKKEATCGSQISIEMKPSKINLEPIDIIDTENKMDKIVTTPIAIEHLDQKELHRYSGIYLEETINLKPGVRMEKRTNSGGQRITIRGYGNNTNFNGLGYKLYYDGVPITDAEGVTIMDAMDFSNLGDVEIYKGPNSSKFGTGIAGFVNLKSIRPEPNQTSIGQDVIGGSYGLLRTNSYIETATDKMAVRVNYGHQSFDGYRTHTGSKKNYASAFASFTPNQKQQFEANISYSQSYEKLAGQLDSADFVNRRNVGETPYLLNDGHVGIENLRASLSHTFKFTKNISNTTKGFVNAYTLNQTYAVGLNDNHALSFGGRTVFDFSFFKEKKVQLDGQVGGEYLKTTSKNSGSSMFGGVLGGLRSQTTIQSQRYFVFTEWTVTLPFEIQITGGLSVNFIEYGVTDLLANSSNPTHLDGSGYKRYKPQFMPRASIQKTWDKKYSVYFSYSQGYTAPTSSDAVIPYTGETNFDLIPETARQYELGTKGNVLDGKLNYEFAAFLMQIDNKLNSKAVTDTAGTVLYTYTVNGGSQNNLGFEAAISYSIIKDEEKVVSLLRPFFNCTYSYFRYKNFKSDANNDSNTVDYSGNQVIGVPPLMINAGVDLGFKFGLYLNSSVQFVDAMSITFNNNHSAPKYTLLNAKIGYQKKWKHFHMDVFFGVNNLLNSLYYNMVFINWEKGPNPAIYSPGAPNPTAYGGFSIKYVF